MTFHADTRDPRGKHEADAQLEEDAPIVLSLEIDNFYEDGDNITTHAEVHVPPIPLTGDDDVEEWEQEYIFPATGTGNPNGSSAYFVKVLDSSDPDEIPVGTEWEFGL